MKTVGAFLVCFLAVALASRAADEGAQVDKAVVECKKELEIPEPKDIASIGPEGFDDNVSEEKKSCFYFCTLKKLGLMYENGSVNKKGIIDLYDPPSEKARMDKVIDNCENTIQPIEGCKMAACLAVDAQPHDKRRIINNQINEEIKP